MSDSSARAGMTMAFMRSALIRSLLALCAWGIHLQASGANAEVPQDQAPYARPGQMVDIGGRRLNLLCMGSGSPTVLFEAGSGEAGWDWMVVHANVAKKTRACLYDRAGLGFSDPSPWPGTSGQAADDLHALLVAAKLPPPFVLVAHSYGAMNARLFTHRHPGWVSGLVLVDGHHEDELPRINRLTEGKYSAMMGFIEKSEAACATAAMAGMAPGSEAFATCVPVPPQGFGRALSAVSRAQFMSLAYWKSASSETTHLNTTSAGQMRAERRPLGDLPVACLTRGISPYLTPGKPQSALNKAVEAENKAMQDEVASLSTRGTNRVVPGASHAIHLDRPQAVVDAISEVLAQQAR